MNLSILIPIILGCATIFQATINKRIALSSSLTQVALMTNVVSLSLCLLLYFYILFNPEGVPAIFQLKKGFQFKLWYLIPGFFGILIVIGIPWAISEFGAIKVSILLISSQLVSSFLWDIFIENISINKNSIIGAVLALLSAAVILVK